MVVTTPTPLTPTTKITGRWIGLLICTIVAYWPSWSRLLAETTRGTVMGYVFVLPFLAIIAAQGLARRRAGELPIHDRQTDNIVGGLGLLFALAIKALWMPRYADQYQLLHLDLLSCLIFVASGSVLLFGLRPVGRFWPVWLLLLALNPLVYRMAAIQMGGTRFDYGLVMVLLAGLAGAIAVARTSRRAMAGAAVTIALGAVILWCTLRIAPGAKMFWIQLVPTLTASALAGTAFYLLARRGVSKKVMDGPLQATKTKRPTDSIAVILVATIVLFFVPLPVDSTPDISPGPAITAAIPPIPAGWTLDSVQEFDWVASYFGSTASLIRQTVTATEPNPAWDADDRPRTLVVDTLDTASVASLGVYPESTMYKLTNTRTSPVVEVDLGHGVVAEMHTSVNEAILVTWTKLVFTWQRGDVAERVTIIAVDNHQPDAVFPEPSPSMASNLGTLFAVFLRGNQIVQDADPDYKDRDLLTAFGTALVDTQMGSRS